MKRNWPRPHLHVLRGYQALLEKGLIKGGSLENAVVIRGEELMSKEPMRFINEFAATRPWNLIGDLSLCGKPILGHVIAIKPGHGPNTELTAKLKKEHRRNQRCAQSRQRAVRRRRTGHQ